MALNLWGHLHNFSGSELLCSTLLLLAISSLAFKKILRVILEMCMLCFRMSECHFWWFHCWEPFGRLHSQALVGNYRWIRNQLYVCWVILMIKRTIFYSLRFFVCSSFCCRCIENSFQSLPFRAGHGLLAELDEFLQACKGWGPSLSLLNWENWEKYQQLC